MHFDEPNRHANHAALTAAFEVPLCETPVAARHEVFGVRARSDSVKIDQRQVRPTPPPLGTRPTVFPNPSRPAVGDRN